MRRPLLLVALMVWLGCRQGLAQSVFSIIDGDRNFAAGCYGIYPDSHLPKLTPAPKGYKPFDISHYGRHGSRYLNDIKAFYTPYQTLLAADSLGKLTPQGQVALHEMRLNIDDAEDRWGDLTGVGKEQQRGIVRRMSRNFPEVFRHGGFVDAYSTIVTRCALSMGTSVLELVREYPDLEVTMNNSYSNMWYMNRQDKSLRDSAMTQRVKTIFDEFVDKHGRNDRLIAMLFNDSAYVSQHVSKMWTAYYLLKAALIQPNTHRRENVNPLLQMFSSEDYHMFWKIENAWSYIRSGFCELNGARQPYLQCYLLRQMISEADSIIQSRKHGASLRFGHETVLLPLVCLMGINGYDYRTADLDSLESKGWWASSVCPMSGNLQIVFYRKNDTDRELLVKVLLNEKEARLPLPSDLAPYYRWSDFREYYLKRVAEGESALGVKR